MKIPRVDRLAIKCGFGFGSLLLGTALFELFRGRRRRIHRRPCLSNPPMARSAGGQRRGERVEPEFDSGTVFRAPAASRLRTRRSDGRASPCTRRYRRGCRFPRIGSVAPGIIGDLHDMRCR